MRNSGYNRQKGIELADRTAGFVGGGKYFLTTWMFFLSTVSSVVVDGEDTSPICRRD